MGWNFHLLNILHTLVFYFLSLSFSSFRLPLSCFNNISTTVSSLLVQSSMLTQHVCSTLLCLNFLLHSQVWQFYYQMSTINVLKCFWKLHIKFTFVILQIFYNKRYFVKLDFRQVRSESSMSVLSVLLWTGEWAVDGYSAATRHRGTGREVLRHDSGRGQRSDPDTVGGASAATRQSLRWCL